MEKKIVVIDDDRTTAKILERFLKKMGFQVFLAEDGARGYSLVRREKPEILITDMLIPKIHGVELCKIIKGDLALHKTKVILMTSVYLNGAHRSSEFLCPNDGFLGKLRGESPRHR